jgi:DNA-binding MurR/RpiR family transcriptional regulator
MPIDKVKLNHIINSKKVELSKTEKIIHKHVIEHPEQVVYDSLGNIAKKLEIGEASLVRYFKKLNYTSFNHFKMELYKAIESLRETDNKPYIESVTSNLIEVINKTKEVINYKDINTATKIILNSKQVLIAGMGISHTSALDMFSKFTRIGINAQVLSDSHFSYMYTAILDEKCCVILYSFSGETQEIVKLAQNCKERDIKVIVISNYINSTLHSYADVFIQTCGFENDFSSGFFGSKISQLYVSDVLVTNCALADVEKTKTYNQMVTNLVIK